jgi:hypothetical protein
MAFETTEKSRSWNNFGKELLVTEMSSYPRFTVVPFTVYLTYSETTLCAKKYG